ncbi:hypothetical protein [Caryophanon tenue]|uniref:Abortive phage infection protein n=1 Tax=Caryophanon tenue TaxID=33978 RepID=A0A1C0YK33_9BACL|nr:hypothetical protein [Caryophanon tenue]OCS87504.1 hypothetical protein A6M13_09365 [Caryophanon tenue]
MTNYVQLLNDLASQKITKIDVSKEEFYAFRELLVKHPKFKHFRGTAHQGGNITYTFLEVPRS